MGTALLLDYYDQMPTPRDGEDAAKWERRLRTALDVFRVRVRERYTEGTLQRLLGGPAVRIRQAATLALGMIGSMQSNSVLASRLQDEDAVVRQMASEALWALWYRADTEANNRELQPLMRLRVSDKALAGLDTLIRKAPQFAEAYNQRAILYFQKQDFLRAAADCERVILLNPLHYGAYSGLAQSYMNLRKTKAALKAFREAYRINPHMRGVEETIRELENVLGEEGMPDDKK